MQMENQIQIDAKIGSCIGILLETNQIFGKIIYLSAVEIGIESQVEGTVFIKYEDILSYRILIDENTVKQIDSTENLSQNTDYKEENLFNITDHKAVSERTNDTALQKLSYKIPDSNTSEQIEKITETFSYFNSIKIPAITDYKKYARKDKSRKSKLIIRIIKEIEKRLTSGYKAIIKNTIISTSISNLLNGQSVEHEKKDIYNFLGSLYFKCDYYKLALDYFELGDDNVSGFMLAESCRLYNRQIKFAVRHLFDKKTKEPYIIKFLVNTFIEQDDYTLVLYLGQNLRKKLNLLPVYHTILSVILRYHGVNINNKFLLKASLENTRQLYSLFCSRPFGTRKVFIYSLCNALVLNKDCYQNPSVPVNPVSARKTEISITENENYPVQDQENTGADAADNISSAQTDSRDITDDSSVPNHRANTVTERFNGIPDYNARGNSAVLRKNYRQAVDYFKLAIDNNQKITSSVPQLVSILTKLEMYSDAYDILKQNEHALNSNVYYNLQISIFKKNKDPSLENDCINAFENLISLARTEGNQIKIFQLTIDLSQYLLKINNCIESFKRLFEIRDEFLKFLDSEDKISGNELLINSYYSAIISDCEKLGDYSRAEEYANELLHLCPQSKVKIAARYQNKPINININLAKEDYLVMATNAEKNKNIDAAIDYYKLAIQNRQKLSTTVPNIVNILSRIDKADEALNILESHIQDLDNFVFCNLKISLYKKLKEKGNKSDCLKAYDYLIAHATDLYKSLSIKVDCGIYLSLLGDYARSAELLTECLMILKSAEISENQIKNIETPLYPALIKNYQKLNDLDSAHKFAKEYLAKNPSSKFALSVLNNNSDYVENNKPKPNPADTGINNSAILQGQEILSNSDFLGLVSIFSYVNDQIDAAHLSELSLNPIKKDKFPGDMTQARDVILKAEQWVQILKKNPRKKLYIMLAITKLYRQLLEKNFDMFEDDVINEDKYYSYIVKGAMELAGSKFQQKANSLESARYLYLQPVFLHSHNENFLDKKVPENDCMTSVYRYIATFFIRDDIHKLLKKINFPTKISSATDMKFLKEDFSDFLRSHLTKGLNTDISTFMADMFLLLHEIPLLEDAFLSAVYFKYIRDDIVRVITSILGRSVPVSFTAEEFRTMWSNAQNIYFRRLYIFIQQINTTINQIFSLSDFTSNLKNLKLFNINIFLTRTDRQYISFLYAILDKIYQFNEISEFDYRTDVLREAEEQASSLNKTIESNPTFFSYEFLRKELIHLISLIGNESDHLYSNSAPNLTIELLGECSVDSYRKIISIPVVLKNEDNVQTAIITSFAVYANNCEECKDVRDSRIFHIGRNDVQKLIKLRVPAYILSEDVLDIEISLRYQYKLNRNKTNEKSQKFKLSVQINKTIPFETIDNKFNILKDGGVVDNKKMFYGRDLFINSLIDQIEKSIGCRNGHCTALYGQTRTGKSSVLLHLRRRLRLSRFGSSCIIINLDSMGMQDLHDTYIVGFLYTILDALSSELSENHKDLVEILKDHNIQIDPDELMKDEDNAQLVFNSIFRKFTSIISNLAKPYIIIITIDEFTYIYDWIRQGKMSDRIMKFWKAFIQNNPIFAVIIGQDHMMKFVEDERFSNDFGATDLKKVSYLSKADAFKLMDEPIMLNKNGVLESRYKKGALDRLYELTSGSAYLIAMLCAGMVDYLNEIRSVYITKAHVDEYLKLNMHNFEEAKFFDPQYHDKSDIINEVQIIKMNKEILKRIAQMSNNKEWTDLSKVAQNEEERKILYNLENRDVVIIDESRRCKIKVALYKEWLIERYGRS